jgi:hypothetical protein
VVIQYLQKSHSWETLYGTGTCSQVLWVTCPIRWLAETFKSPFEKPSNASSVQWRNRNVWISVVNPDPESDPKLSAGSGSGQLLSIWNKTSLIKFTQPDVFPYTIPYLFQNNKHYISLFSKKTLYIVVISRIQCEFAAQLSRGGDQHCRIRNRIRIRSRSRNFLKSRIRIRNRIRNKSFRIHNPGLNPFLKILTGVLVFTARFTPTLFAQTLMIFSANSLYLSLILMV